MANLGKGAACASHWILVFGLLLLSGCGGGGAHAGAAAVPAAPGGASATPTPATQLFTPSAIHHVIFIVQENRSFDNLFNGFPGADTVASGKAHDGSTVTLQPVSLSVEADPNHAHSNFLTAYDGGKNDGWDQLGSYVPPGQPQQGPLYPYAYVPQSETGIYWQLAQQFTLADRMFQSNSGPSFAAHQYLIAAQSNNVSEVPTQLPWGCDAPAGTTTMQTDSGGNDVPGPFPCFNYLTLGDEMDQAGISWRFYAPAVITQDIGYIWSAFDAVRQVRFGSDWNSRISSPPGNILNDVANGTLAQMTWVVPDANESDHARFGAQNGPQWVGSIVNAVANSQYWKDSAIFIVWDDWGGWYDHVLPPQLDQNGLGYRVPLIVVSPYARSGYVSHVQHEFGSLLHFAEEAFNLPSLGQVDARADDLRDCFDFSQAPHAPPQLQSRLRKMDFMHEVDREPIDY